MGGEEVWGGERGGKAGRGYILDLLTQLCWRKNKRLGSELVSFVKETGLHLTRSKQLLKSFTQESDVAVSILERDLGCRQRNWIYYRLGIKQSSRSYQLDVTQLMPHSFTEPWPNGLSSNFINNLSVSSLCYHSNTVVVVFFSFFANSWWKSSFFSLNGHDTVLILRIFLVSASLDRFQTFTKKQNKTKLYIS